MLPTAGIVASGLGPGGIRSATNQNSHARAGFIQGARSGATSGAPTGRWARIGSKAVKATRGLVFLPSVRVRVPNCHGASSVNGRPQIRAEWNIEDNNMPPTLELDCLLCRASGFRAIEEYFSKDEVWSHMQPRVCADIGRTR